MNNPTMTIEWLKSLEGQDVKTATQRVVDQGLQALPHSPGSMLPAVAIPNAVHLFVRDGIVTDAAAGDPCQVGRAEDRWRLQAKSVEAFRLPELDEPVGEEFRQWCKRVQFLNFTSERDGGLAWEDDGNFEVAGPGDWIVQIAPGRFLPMDDDLFWALVERY